jgi:hypothetical protein
MEKLRAKTARVPVKGSLGTFSGVFTPSILTILGIILFLRLGYVVGSAGLFYTLVIITLANAISVLTSISLSAIATNIRVKGGGSTGSSIPCRRPYISLSPSLFKRVRPKRKSETRCYHHRRDCLNRYCTRKSECDSEGSIHVFPHILRPS